MLECRALDYCQFIDTFRHNMPFTVDSAFNITYPCSCAFVSPCTAPKVSLVDGPSPAEGRVQVEYDGVIGSVCDNSWSRYDARALCQQLGYKDGIAKDNSYYGPGTGPVYLDDMRCRSYRSGDDSIFTCPSSGWNDTSYRCRDHSNDAGAVCYASGMFAGGDFVSTSTLRW